MRTMKSLTVSILLAYSVVFYTASAQSLSVNAGTDTNKKTETKTVEKVVEKSTPSVAQELRKFFGVKSETSLDGPRIENIGRYFLDKYTGEVTIVSFQFNEPVRWKLRRESIPEDLVYDPQTVNYQMFKVGTGDNDIVLMNINTGVMWAPDIKPLSVNHRKTVLKYIPITETEY